MSQWTRLPGQRTKFAPSLCSSFFFWDTFNWNPTEEGSKTKSSSIPASSCNVLGASIRSSANRIFVNRFLAPTRSPWCFSFCVHLRRAVPSLPWRTMDWSRRLNSHHIEFEKNPYYWCIVAGPDTSAVTVHSIPVVHAALATPRPKSQIRYDQMFSLKVKLQTIWENSIPRFYSRQIQKQRTHPQCKFVVWNQFGHCIVPFPKRQVISSTKCCNPICFDNWQTKTRQSMVSNYMVSSTTHWFDKKSNR